LNVSRFKCTPLPPYSLDIAPSDFLLFGWPETQLKRRECNGEDELYAVLDEILTDLSIEMIETVFVNRTNPLQRLIDGDGDSVS
jgi:hypothetical protein